MEGLGFGRSKGLVLHDPPELLLIEHKITVKIELLQQSQSVNVKS